MLSWLINRNYRTVIPQLQCFATLHRLNMQVPPLPRKEAMLQTFSNYLIQSAQPQPITTTA